MLENFLILYVIYKLRIILVKKKLSNIGRKGLEPLTA